MSGLNYLDINTTSTNSAYRATELAAHIQYLGWAKPGTVVGATTGWKICKVTYDTATDSTIISITWPNGSSSFAYEWDERASYSYS